MKKFCGALLLLFLCLVPGLLDYFDVPSTYCGANNTTVIDGNGIGTSIVLVIVYIFIVSMELLGIEPPS